MIWLGSTVAMLTLMIGGPASAQNLVANPGFETGDFTGWTQGGNTGATFVTAGPFDGFLPHSGNFFAALGPVGSDGTLSQDLATTPGHSYTFKLVLGQRRWHDQ
jgi:hypothetical protein